MSAWATAVAGAATGTIAATGVMAVTEAPGAAARRHLGVERLREVVAGMITEVVATITVAAITEWVSDNRMRPKWKSDARSPANRAVMRRDSFGIPSGIFRF